MMRFEKGDVNHDLGKKKNIQESVENYRSKNTSWWIECILGNLDKFRQSKVYKRS